MCNIAKPIWPLLNAWRRKKAGIIIFDHRADSHELRFGHQSIASPILGTLTYNAKPAGDRSFACLWRFDYCRKVTTTRQTLRDYTFLNPNYNLEHQHHSQASALTDSDTSKSAVNSATVYEKYDYPDDIRKMNKAIRLVFIV